MNASTSQLRLRAARRGHARRGGFTLLELVVSLLMVAVLVIPLYSSMKTAFKAQQSGEAVVEPARTVELAMDLIRPDIQNAVLPNPNASKIRVLAGPFVGNPGNDDRGHADDDLIFFTTAEGPRTVDLTQTDPMLARQQQNPIPDIRQVELNVVTDNNGDHVLLRRVTSNLLADSATTITPDDEVLCRGVSSFSARYFNGSDWSTSWDSEDDNTIPIAVEITIELERPGGTVMNAQNVPVMRFIRVFQLPCSTGNPDTSQTTTGG